MEKREIIPFLERIQKVVSERIATKEIELAKLSAIHDGYCTDCGYYELKQDIEYERGRLYEVTYILEHLKG